MYSSRKAGRVLSGVSAVCWAIDYGLPLWMVVVGGRGAICGAVPYRRKVGATGGDPPVMVLD